GLVGDGGGRPAAAPALELGDLALAGGEGGVDPLDDAGHDRLVRFGGQDQHALVPPHSHLLWTGTAPEGAGTVDRSSVPAAASPHPLRTLARPADTEPGRPRATTATTRTGTTP